RSNRRCRVRGSLVRLRLRARREGGERTGEREHEQQRRQRPGGRGARAAALSARLPIGVSARLPVGVSARLPVGVSARLPVRQSAGEWSRAFGGLGGFHEWAVGHGSPNAAKSSKTRDLRGGRRPERPTYRSRASFGQVLFFFLARCNRPRRFNRAGA